MIHSSRVSVLIGLMLLIGPAFLMAGCVEAEPGSMGDEIVRTPHAPIRVYNDTQLHDLGFPGEGTAEDPYRIENLNIDSSAYDIWPGLILAFTSKHVIVSNCSISNATNGLMFNDGGKPADVFASQVFVYKASNIMLSSCVVQSTLSAGVGGIGVVSSSNMTVHDTVISDTNSALKVKSVTNFTFSNNLVRSGLDGLYFEGGNGLRVDNNTVNGALGYAVSVESVNNVSICDNTLLDYSGGNSLIFAPIEISRSSDGEIRRNLIDSSAHSGIVLFDTEGYIVDGNTITNSGNYGIYLDEPALGGPHVISNNTVTSAEYGIWAEGDNTSVENNVITDISWLGIYLSNSDDGRVVGNTITNATRGFGLTDCYRANMTMNVISEPAVLLGVIQGNAEGSRIWLNAFYHNSQSVIDSSGEISWHFGGLGNYWSFVNGLNNADNDRNGIWDNPVSILSTSSADEFPLTSPIGPPSNMTAIDDGNYGVLFHFERPQWLIGEPITDMYFYRYDGYGVMGWPIGPAGLTLRDQSVTPGINYTYGAYATRGSELGVVRSLNITLIDSTLPTVNVSSPRDGQSFTGLPIQINWNGSDDFKLGVHHYMVGLSPDSYTYVAGSTTSFNITSIPDGQHTFVVEAYDYYGNMAYATVRIIVDAVGPELIISSPEEESAVRGEALLGWTVSDNGSAVALVQYRLNGGPWINVTGNSLSLTGLADGPHSVELRAYDLNGHSTTRVIHFFSDTGKPWADITWPASNELINASSVWVTWISDDTITKIATAEVSLDGGAYISAAYLDRHLFSSLSDGTHAVSVRVTDLAGNYHVVNISFVIDTTPPLLSILLPGEGSSHGVDVNVSWTGSDITSGLDRYEIRIDGGEWQPRGKLASIELFGLDLGQHVVRVRAWDVAGNSATAERMFYVDLAGPVVELSHGSTVITNDWTFLVEWTGSDDASGIAYYLLRYDGAVVYGGTSLNYEVDISNTGEHLVEIVAYDRAGKSGSDSFVLIVDRSGPLVRMIEPEHNSLLSDSRVVVSWTGSDRLGGENDGVHHYEISVNGGPYRDIGRDTSAELELQDGKHIVRIKAFDMLGNERISLVRFFIDTTAPEASILSPTEGGWCKGTVNVVAQGTDRQSSVVYQFRLDGGDWSSSGASGTMTYQSLSAGRHNVEVMVTDEAGHSNVASVSFTVDLTAPSVVDRIPQGKSVSPYSAIKMTFSEAMDPASLQFALTGVEGTVTMVGNVMVFAPSSPLLENTVYRATVSGADLAGNKLNETWSFATTSVSRVSGTVVGPDGQRISGATVTLDSGETAVTDGEGRFSFWATLGEHKVSVSMDGYGNGTSTITVGTGAAEVGEIKLSEKSSSVAGIGSEVMAAVAVVAIAVVAVGVLFLRRKP